MVCDPFVSLHSTYSNASVNSPTVNSVEGKLVSVAKLPVELDEPNQDIKSFLHLYIFKQHKYI